MQYTLFMILSPVVAVCMAAAGLTIRRQSRAWLARPLEAAIWLCLAFLVTNTLELAWPTEGGTLLFAKLSYLCSTPIPVAFFLFTLAYTGRSDLFAGARRLVLFVIPAGISALALTEPAHHLIWATISYTRYQWMLAMNVTYGPLFWVNTIYAVGLLLVSLALFAWSSARAGWPYRAQSFLAIAGICIPLLLFLVYTFKLIPGFTKNYSPIAYCAPALCLVAAIRQHRFLDLVPIARRTVMEELADAIVVVDSDHRLLDLNDRARALLGFGEEALGTPLPAGSPLRIALESRLLPGEPHVISLQESGEQRFFDARVTPIKARRPQAAGSVVLLRDVTDSHRLLQEKSRLVEELSKAAAEIDDLRKILPICMYCKKIRDDEGYWHAVENYISARLPAQFTHSLCPDCMKKYFPQ